MQALRECRAVADTVKAMANIRAGAAEIGEIVTTIASIAFPLGEFPTDVREVAATIEDIANARREQTTGVQEVSAAVGRMDEATQQNAGMADRSAAAARALAEQSQRVAALVEASGAGGCAAKGRARAGGLSRVAVSRSRPGSVRSRDRGVRPRPPDR